MGLLLQTTTVTTSRPPSKVDGMDPATYTTVLTAEPARLSGVSGSEARAQGTTETSDARLFLRPDADVRRQDRVVDDLTGETWDVAWVRVKTGLGLDHLAVAVNRTKGAG